MRIEDIRGVNLGGWLVLERWIAPSVFKGTDATDEYSLCQTLGLEQSRSRLKKHRDTFITEEHVKHIAKLGLNTVRLPVGYWLFEDQPPFAGGGVGYVEKLFIWAEKYNLKVILDFHAAPGSQNGWDHSGKAGVIGWSENPANIEQSINFIKQLTMHFGKNETLLGVEPLNEPHWDVPLQTLVKYYQEAREIIIYNCLESVKTIVSDAFRAKDMSKALTQAKLIDVVLDIHLYQLFTPEDRALNLEGHLNKIKTEWSKELSSLRRHHEAVVGEWSAAMSELYESQNQQTQRTQRTYTSHDYKLYGGSQARAFEAARAGWIYWTARTEDAGIWSLLDHTELLK